MISGRGRGFGRAPFKRGTLPGVQLHQDLRTAVRDLCKAFPDTYWRELDVQRAYPEAFVKALTDAGYLAALIPEEYGGSGLGVIEASIILEEINRSGGNAGACHAQMYTMGTLLRHGSAAQKRAFLPKIATGELRLQAFGVTEPTTGSDTTQLKTTATRNGEEGKGCRYLLDGLNAERILIAAECVGDGRWFIERATRYANERVVFNRPIGQNQGVQFPIARAHVNVEAADLMRLKAAAMFDRGEPCGAEANMAKLLAADASWEAANVAVQTHGGFGFAEDYDVERKFRETRLYQVAPISTNLILAYVAEHVLGLPRSY